MRGRDFIVFARRVMYVRFPIGSVPCAARLRRREKRRGEKRREEGKRGEKRRK